MGATAGILYEDVDLPRHAHTNGGHTHVVLKGRTAAIDAAGNRKIRTPADRPLWFAPGEEHAIECEERGTVYFNSNPV